MLRPPHTRSDCLVVYPLDRAAELSLDDEALIGGWHLWVRENNQTAGENG